MLFKNKETTTLYLFKVRLTNNLKSDFIIIAKNDKECFKILKTTDIYGIVSEYYNEKQLYDLFNKFLEKDCKKAEIISHNFKGNLFYI